MTNVSVMIIFFPAAYIHIGVTKGRQPIQDQWSVLGADILNNLRNNYCGRSSNYPQWRHQGGVGAFAPIGGSDPPHLPPQSEEKNGQNQPFSANFWIFAPSESHFAPSMPPTKKFLVPPLTIRNVFS